MKFWIKQLLFVIILTCVSIFTNFLLKKFLHLNENNIFIFISNGFIIFIIQFLFENEYKQLQQKDLEKYKSKINQNLESYKVEITKELEFYRSKLNNCVLVTKLQYELEFKIYQELYSKLMKNYKLICNKTSLFSENDLINFNVEILKYQPFIDKDIGNQICIITNLFSSYLKGDNNMSLVISVHEIQKLADLIKNRIETMKIIDN